MFDLLKIECIVAYISAGFLLGPMFPTIISITSKVLPRKYHATSIGFMSA
jgi:fucose permease